MAHKQKLTKKQNKKENIASSCYKQNTILSLQNKHSHTQSIKNNKFILKIRLLFGIRLILIFVIHILVIIVLTVIITIRIDNRVLFILVFGDQISHILIRFVEFHLIHTFALVPVQKCFSSVHLGKLSANPLKHALNRRGVGHKCSRNIRSLWRHRDDRSLDVIRYPSHKIIRHFL